MKYSSKNEKNVTQAFLKQTPIYKKALEEYSSVSGIGKSQSPTNADESPKVRELEVLQKKADESPRVRELEALQKKADESPRVREVEALLKKADEHVRAKYNISTPDDPAEIEADRIATTVTGITTPDEKGINEVIMCKENHEGKKYLMNVTNQIDSTFSSGGIPLPESIKIEMGKKIGHDFSSVKIHDDTKAHHSSRAINAKAYTKGNDIVFAKGQYQPESSTGKHLIAHELAHVVQQTNGPVKIHRYAAPTDWLDYIGLAVDAIERIYIEVAYEEGDEKEFKRFVNTLFFVIDGILAATPGAGGGGLAFRGSKQLAIAGWGVVPDSFKVQVIKELAKQMGWRYAKAAQMIGLFFSMSSRPEKGTSFRGGNKKSRDQWYGYNDEHFKRWWHRKGKKLWGGGDILNKEMAKEIFDYWVSIGSPTVK